MKLIKGWEFLEGNYYFIQISKSFRSHILWHSRSLRVSSLLYIRGVMSFRIEDKKFRESKLSFPFLSCVIGQTSFQFIGMEAKCFH